MVSIDTSIRDEIVLGVNPRRQTRKRRRAPPLPELMFEVAVAVSALAAVLAVGAGGRPKTEIDETEFCEMVTGGYKASDLAIHFNVSWVARCQVTFARVRFAFRLLYGVGAEHAHCVRRWTDATFASAFRRFPKGRSNALKRNTNAGLSIPSTTTS